MRQTPTPRLRTRGRLTAAAFAVASLAWASVAQAADTNPPVVSFESPIAIPNRDGEDRFPTQSLTLDEVRPLLFGCFDFAVDAAEPASGIASCDADLDGQSVSSGDPVPTTGAGLRTLRITARDVAGNETVAERQYRVLAGELVETQAIGTSVPFQHETYSTDPGRTGASPRVPVQTRVLPPDGASGPLSISIWPSAPVPPAPLAPLAGATALRVQSPGRTVNAPSIARLWFTIDASLLPADPERVRILKDGLVVPRCGGPGEPVPCFGGLDYGDELGNGDWTIPVLSIEGDISDAAPPGELRERFDAVWSFAVTPEDVTPPSVTLTDPAAGAVFLQGANPQLGLACTDELFGSGLASCVAEIDGVGPYPDGSILPTTVGSHTVRAIGTDRAGNQVTVDRTYEVPAGSATGTVGGGGAVSTGAAATPAEPLQTEVLLPDTSAGLITIQPTASQAPAGYALLPGTPALQISAPNGTAAAPLRLTFLVDVSVLAGPPAVDLAAVIPLRNGVPVPDCAAPGVASPDPCITSRAVASEDGDGRIVVLTSQASTWALATRSEVFAFSGFLGVRVPPALNPGDAGESQRLVFRLGGNRGLAIFSQTPPASRGISCRTGAPSGAGTFTPLGRVTLSYSARQQRYSMTWAAPRSWRGTCREVRIGFRDGTSASVRYRYS